MIPDKVKIYDDVVGKNKRVFKVPVYQRNYDWSLKHCGQLYDDIIKAYHSDKKHFTGTIVYVVENNTSRLDKAVIIDGQQRLTTVYILLKAMMDAATDTSESSVAHDIEYAMFNRDTEDTNRIKLKLVRNDDEQIRLLIANRNDEMAKNSNVYKNYEFFKRKIKGSVDSGIKIRDILHGIEQLEMVEIVLNANDDEDPQKIFESINSTGKELTLGDKIRNYLLMGNINQETLYDNYWTSIEKNVKNVNLEDFVITFLNSRDSRSFKNDDAYDVFKTHFENADTSKEDIIKELKRDSRYYGTLKGNLDGVFSEEVTVLLHTFGLIKQTTVNPLLFRILRDYEEGRINEESLLKVLRYLVTYLIRITACEINKNLSKFFKGMYERVVINDEVYSEYSDRFATFLNNCNSNDRMPTDEEFKNALIYGQLYKKPICKYVLVSIENSTNEVLDIDNLTIEHILPQKENSAVWKHEVGEQYTEVYNRYLHTLGNLTITGYNSELGTKSFNDKKRIIRQNSHVNILNQMVLSADRWNEISIRKRADKLADKLIEIFKYENTGSSMCIGADGFEYHIGDEGDISEIKLVGFALLGESFLAGSWKKVFEILMGILNGIDGHRMAILADMDFSVCGIEGTCISRDKTKVGKNSKLDGTNIYFRTKLSEDEYVMFIAGLLDEYGLDNQEFVCFLKCKPFNFNDESSWDDGGIPTAKMFYNMFYNLAEQGRLEEDEIEKLKTKTYTKSLFTRNDYTAISNNPAEYMSSGTKRFRVKPVCVNGTDVYVSTQFFDPDREAIIRWYKSHI